MLVQRLVQSRHPYIVRRGSRYSFRFVVPRHARRICPELPTEIKRTLRTDSFPEALYLVSQKTQVIRRIKQSRDKAHLKRLCDLLARFDEQHEEVVAQSISMLSGRSVAVQASPTALPVDTPKEPQSPKLSEVWKKFVVWKNWPDKARKNNESFMETLLFFLGDVPVHTITKKDLKDALEKVSRLPQRNRKQYKDKPLSELVKLKIPQEHRISDKTVKEYLKLCQGLFNTYLVKELELLEKSPTDGLKLHVDDRRFACLADAQVREVIERAGEKPEWVRWFMLVAAYSGARRSELAQLQTQDFRCCPDSGRNYFVINRGKTKAARRMVPVHPRLEGEGLMEWIKSINGPLFPVAQATPNRVTAHFGDLVRVKTNDLGERVVFHSLRHTFITKARAAGVSTVLVQQVVGHEKSGAGITDRYTHSFPLKDLLPVVDAVCYQSSGLDKA